MDVLRVAMVELQGEKTQGVSASFALKTGGDDSSPLYLPLSSRLRIVAKLLFL